MAATGPETLTPEQERKFAEINRTGNYYGKRALIEKLSAQDQALFNVYQQKRTNIERPQTTPFYGSAYRNDQNNAAARAATPESSDSSDSDNDREPNQEQEKVVRTRRLSFP